MPPDGNRNVALKDTAVAEEGRGKQIRSLAVPALGLGSRRGDDRGVVLVEHRTTVEVRERKRRQPGPVVEVRADRAVLIRVPNAHRLGDRLRANDDLVAFDHGRRVVPDLVPPGQTEVPKSLIGRLPRGLDEGVGAVPRVRLEPLATHHQAATGTALLEADAYRVAVDRVGAGRSVPRTRSRLDRSPWRGPSARAASPDRAC